MLHYNPQNQNTVFPTEKITLLFTFLVASVIFFGGYGIYVWLITYYSGQKRVRLSLLLIRLMCTIIGGLSLAVFIILRKSMD